MHRSTPLTINIEQVKNCDNRPWRPFRRQYRQTMSIYDVNINHWLDADKYYCHYIQNKQRVRYNYANESVD